ncbi:rod shape-determining protein MreC [Thiomicrorhabdus arctica]|uniref:rod shape-determining protein MreC n=1 Tax=Thiomicrorhabdus arctica TaxID=131540 RepID=UPI000381ECB0|nr:rod shape-determining protein MreC [Thiomicrorhabdus arctica]
MHFVIAFIAAIALMSADHYGHLMGNFRNALLTTITPLEQIASLPKQIYQWTTTDFTSIDALKIKNQKLETEILLLKAKQQQFTNLELEVDRLESLLGTTGKITNQSVQIATITYYSSNPLSQFLTINRGYLNGISEQQTVIDSEGIMGQITATTPTSSRVLLITDPDHQIPVRIQRTGQRGILRGTGQDTTKLDFIPKNSVVRKGDILESSGLGGLFPAGYPVATVTQVDELGDNPYLDVTARPIAQLHRSRKVLIISKEPLPTKPKEVENGQ